ASPLSILGNKKVTGVRFAKTKTENGKLASNADSEFDIECDMVIRATGQSKLTDLLNAINGIELDKNGAIKTDNKTFQTSHPKYFAGGDAVNGGAEVVNAVAEAKRAAQGVHQVLTRATMTGAVY